ncbi:MAG: phosphopantothenoylcysteine decarboxylase, partial [Clostridiales bacterium]|nr:phosphopantothenoylcysteine decarboxylase [Clostridiales bacterium]
PTREALDPVRFLSNRSSGRMGYAIAQAALSRGAAVTLVTGPVSIRPPGGARVVHVVTTDDLYREVTGRAPSHDIIIQAAAPADYRPKAAAAEKIKKQPGQSLAIELVQTPDVAKAVGEQKKPGQTLVGFAAETGPLVGNARQKLQDKNLDLIAFNDVAKEGSGFDVDTNELTFITADGAEALPLMTKREAADRLLDRVLRLRNEKAG